MDTEEKLAAALASGITIRQATVLGHRINYAVCGLGDPVLLIHGGTFGWGAWFANIKALASHFTVYAIDLPGAGRSSSIDYQKMEPQKDFIDVVTAFIRAQNINPSVIGHSFGGWVALQVAKNVDIRKLVLVDPVGFSAHVTLSDRFISCYPIARFLSGTILKAERDNTAVEGLLRSAFYGKKTALLPEFLDYFYDIMRMHHNLLFVSRIIKLRKELYLDGRGITLPCPTLVTWGAHDPISPLRWSQENVREIRNAKIEIFPNAGHVPQIEQSREFNELIVDFLQT